MTKIPYHQLAAAYYWAELGGHSYKPLVHVSNGRLTLASTNSHGASWVSWPADVEQENTCSVPTVKLRQVRTVRGLLWLLKRLGDNASFNFQYIESLAELPSRAEAVMTRAEVEQVVAHLDYLLWGDGYVSVDVLDGRLYIGRRSFAATVSYWREQEPLDLNLSFIREIFAHVFSPTITLSIKRSGKMRLLHVSGESGNVRENHILVGLRWN